MTFNKTLLVATMLTLGGFAAMSSANAADATPSDFDVTLEVTGTCAIQTGTADIALGTTSTGLGASTAAKSTDITLNCSKGTTYVMSLTPASGSLLGTGVMKGGIGDLEEVAYKLSTDAGGVTAWGATAPTNTVTGTALLYATAMTNTVYATVTGSADVTPDTYTDTVAISVTY